MDGTPTIGMGQGTQKRNFWPKQKSAKVIPTHTRTARSLYTTTCTTNYDVMIFTVRCAGPTVVGHRIATCRRPIFHHQHLHKKAFFTTQTFSNFSNSSTARVRTSVCQHVCTRVCMYVVYVGMHEIDASWTGVLRVVSTLPSKNRLHSQQVAKLNNHLLRQHTRP